MCYGQLGQAESARAALDRVIELRPDFASTAAQNFRRRNVSEPVIDTILTGLRKAGMTVTAVDE